MTMTTDKRWEVLHGDCLDVMRGMADASVDAVVTDPPYGVDFKYSSGVDVAKTPQAYGQWLATVLPEIDRLLKPGGALVCWQSGTHWRYLWDWFGDDIRVLSHAKNFVQLRKTPVNRACDPVVVRYKDGALPFRPAKPPRNVDFFVSNTAALVSKPDRIERGHPCPRPLDAVEWVVQNFVGPVGGIVLDPFTGSGTTGVAAIREGFRFVGIEREAQYVEIAKKRIEAATEQGDLFAAK